MELTLRSTRTAPVYPEHMLVSAARRGDDRAFEELYSRYRQRIFAYIVSKVRDHGRAEDIAQEVFISALRRLHSSDQAISFKPWIYEIAKNACIDEFRRGSRSREVALEPDDEPASGGRPMMAVVPTPPDAVENRQRLDDLRGAFGGLSENHHQLLVLREFEGLSYDEIGDRLGMTRQMVESGLFRARRKLTEEYDELASGRRCTQIQTAIESGSAQSITSLGVRERRRFARHLAHCQACRHTARMAGVDEALLKPRSIAAKIAALLPFPLWRWPWGGGHGRGTATNAATRSGSGHLARGPLRGAARVMQPASSPVSLGQAAAAVAALAIAGAGTGLVVGSQHHHTGPSSATLAAASSAARAHSQQSGSGSTTWPGAALTPAGRSASAAALSIEGTRLFVIPSQSGLSGSPSSGSGSSSAAPGTGAGPTGSPVGGLPLNGATGAAGATGATVLKDAGSAVSKLKNSADPTIAGVKRAVNSTASRINKTAGSTVGGVKKTVGSTTSGLKSTAGSATSGVKSAAGSATSGVKSAAGSATSGVKSAAGPATAGVKSVGSQVSGAAGAIASATKPAPSGAPASAAAVPKATSSATKATGSATKAIGGSSTSTPSPASVVHSVTAPAKSVVSGVLTK